MRITSYFTDFYHFYFLLQNEAIPYYIIYDIHTIVRLFTPQSKHKQKE